MGLRDPRFTAINYQMRGQELGAIPRHKFMFWVRFVTGQSTGNTSDPNSRWPSGVSFKVLSADRPKFSIKHQTLNQYNKKRVVQTGVEYQPITLRFYDTYDDELLKMVRDYSRFYYGDFNNYASSAWKHDIVNGEMDMGAGYWGYFNQVAENPDDSYYFERIEIYTFGNNEYTRWDLIKPKIVDFSPDSMDYSEGGSATTATLTLAYEGVIWPMIGEKMTTDDVSMMGLDQGEFGDVATDANLSFPSTPENVKAAANALASASGGDSAEYFNTLMNAVEQSKSGVSSTTPLNLPQSMINIGSALGLDFGNIGSAINSINNLGVGNIASALSSNGLSSIINTASGLMGGNLSSTLNTALGKLTSLTSSFGGSSIGNIFQGGSLGGMLSQVSSGLGNIMGSINSITSTASSFLGNIGGIGNVFGGFFSSDELTDALRLKMAQPINDTMYQEYYIIADAAMAAVDVFIIMFKYDAMPRSVKEAIDDIKQAQHTPWLLIGQTSILQLYEKTKDIGKNLSVLNDYIYKVQLRASSSPAVYESAVAKAQQLGIKDPTLSGMVASDIVAQSKQNGTNVIDYNATQVNPKIYDYLNKNMGSEIQIGVMNPNVLYKTSANPTQRALQRQTVVQTDYHVYLESGINPDLLNG